MTTKIGAEILAYCGTCKMDLLSIIVAKKDVKIAKVQCKTCKKDHVYKAPKGITEPGPKPEKKTRAKKEKAPEAAPIEAEWEKLMLIHKNAPVKNYSMKSQFGLGDRITHPTFGEGIVGKLIYPNKLEVIFRHDLKVLIHGGAVVVSNAIG